MCGRVGVPGGNHCCHQPIQPGIKIIVITIETVCLIQNPRYTARPLGP